MRLRLDLTWIAASPLLEMARQARRLPHGVVVILMALVIPFFAGLVAAPFALALSFLPSEHFLGKFEMAFLLLLSFGGILFLLWIWTRWVERRSFATLGFAAKSPFLPYARGFIVGVILIALGLFLTWIFGAKIEIQSSPVPFPRRLLFALLFLPAWMVQGAAEEVLIRGWMLPVFGLRHGIKASIFVSAVTFAALHALNPGLTPLALLNLTLFGIFAALYALKEGGLWGICALHAAWNWSLSNLFGLSVSGMESDLSLLSLHIKGGYWLTGGAFGPEGGVTATFLMVLAMGWLLADMERK